VLAGVAQGWDRSQVLAELGDRVDDSRLYQTWLVEKFGLGLLKAATRDEELVRRLEQLRSLHQVDNIGSQINIHVLE
jgi:hypothetical protein